MLLRTLYKILVGVFLILAPQVKAQFDESRYIGNGQAAYFKKKHIALLSIRDSDVVRQFAFDRQGRIIMKSNSVEVPADILRYYFDSLGRVTGSLVISYPYNEPDTSDYTFVRYDKHNLFTSMVSLHQSTARNYNEATGKYEKAKSGSLSCLRNDTNFSYIFDENRYTLTEFWVYHYIYSGKRTFETVFSYKVNDDDTTCTGGGISIYDREGRELRSSSFMPTGHPTAPDTLTTIPRDWILISDHAFSYGRGRYPDMQKKYSRNLMKKHSKKVLDYTPHITRKPFPFDEDLRKLVEEKAPNVTVTCY